MIRKSLPKFYQLEKRDEDVLVIVFRTCLSARFVAKSQRSIAAGLITIDGQARPSCCPLFHWTRAAFSSFSFYFSFFRVFFLFFFCRRETTPREGDRRTTSLTEQRLYNTFILESIRAS